jgi:hypothetical protein
MPQMKIFFAKLNHRIQILRQILKQRGLKYSIKRIFLFLIRPILDFTDKSKFLIELRYGFLINLRYRFFFKNSSKFLKLTKSDLIERVRYFWYTNESGFFDLDGEKISRGEISIYGGPNPKFICPICQKSEWLSRVRQKNLFIPHSCPQAKECEELCKKQGDDFWTHYHQNFDFAIGCDQNLPAPKCLLLVPKQSFKNFFYVGCDQGKLISKRRFAFAFQYDVVQEPPINIDWSKYDFLFIFNEGNNIKFKRPKIPIILYGHDFWEKKKGYQWVIDWLRPDVFLTSYPTCWKENFKFPENTKISFYPLFPSMFFTRPNLREKKIDLLVIGAVTSSIYRGRILLDKQIRKLNSKYKIEFSHVAGTLSSVWKGPVEYIDPLSKQKIRYLNKWSEYLGSAKYVIFGRMKYPVMVWKYYETLGSGAIPIFPEVSDLKYLGVKPFEHYIPLSEVEGNNERLKYLLNNYEKYKYIAQNAVRWFRENERKLFFEDFEKVIREITNYKYPKRLI